ncbi:MAG TPA: FecR domain-containing protein [Terriglobales bacterium]|nr:FecR domain-containing protein [Terriglobales bacterium]
MNGTNKDRQDLDAAINAMRNDQPTDEQVNSATGRLWQKMQSAEVEAPEIIHGCEDVVRLLPAYANRALSGQRMLLVEAHLRDCVSCRRKAEGRESAQVLKWAPVESAKTSAAWPRWALAAAVVIFAVLGFYVNNAYFAVPAGARGTLQSLEGTAFLVTPNGDRVVTAGQVLNEGDVLRTASDSHAYVRLSDGSLVEVRERSELAVKARGRDTTIALDRGAVIIQAAKRDSGHLYVKTPDSRVAVTGTVFSVNAGVKGTRVFVVEGAVEVQHGGSDDLLHAGDQVATGENMANVSAASELAWSKDLSKHLELLAQFKQLEKKLEQVTLPAPRYESRLLGRMPADAVIYASLPNAGQALEDANRIFQDQIEQSAALREWFTHGDAHAAAKMNETIAKIRALSDYLGNEVVVVGFGGPESGMAIVAEVERPGLREFLQSQFKSSDGQPDMLVIDEAQLGTVPAGYRGLIALIRQNEVVFSGNHGNALAKVNAQLNSSAAGLDKTAFGQRLLEAYNRGAGFVFAADLKTLIAEKKARHVKQGRPQVAMARTGLENMRYLVLEHRELNQVPENRMVLDFAGQRYGVPSWLAAPAPMGSLEFVSRNASVAIALLAKDPQAIMTDIFSMGGNPAKQQAHLAEAESKLRLRIREDLAAHFGGDIVFALDGPVLPMPSWKLVIEVHDAARLQASLETLVGSFNQEAQQHGKPGLDLKAEDVNGQRYYTLQPRSTKAKPFYYTYSAGYMIAGPDRATVMNTLRVRATGDSLARSGEFKALLPKDENANYSVIAYQNLAPILQPLTSVVNGQQAKVLQELAADSRPSVICGWGRENQIEAITNSRFIGFDWLALTSLFSKGTTNRQTP